MCKYYYFRTFLLSLVVRCFAQDVIISGPGLQPDKIVMPARYFYLNFTTDGSKYSQNVAEKYAIEITGTSNKHKQCRVWVNKLDRKDGTFIVRYKVYETCSDLSINIYFRSKHVNGSPFKIQGPIYADLCSCPESNFETWQKQYGCPSTYDQLEHDLVIFSQVDMEIQVKKIIEKHHKPESTSFCHYVVKDNLVHRKCYGKHVGFNMFADNILLSLSRKVVLPDMELVINLGDWPLARKSSEPLPIFSWCGSDDTLDIIMPTYDITESTLENMGRVTLDILSVQGSIDREWSEREPRLFWRGRDSRAERLKLIDIAREQPDLFNVSLTNFFFFRDKEAEYGPKQPHVSFFKFFDYKYQMNVDGTVAAYRLPYLLAGGGLIFKQASPYYEHFYRSLQPWTHYIPVSRDLSDLLPRLRWAARHDAEARRVAENAREFANENVMPQHVFCYHAVLFKEWSKRLVSEVRVREDMTPVLQPKFECDCQSTSHDGHRDEL